MTLIRTTAANFIGGVSQQPAAVRRADQCEILVNGWPSPVNGMMKRQPTKHVSKVINGAIPAFKWHTIYRDSAEQYLVGFKPTGVVVWDLVANVSRTVIDETGGFGYLSSITSEDDVSAMTIADTTFVSNRKTVTAMKVGTTPAQPTGANDEAYVFVRQGNYLSEYKVSFRIASTNYTVTCKTWDGTNSIGAMPGAIGTGLIDSVKTSDIAADLRLQIANLAIANLTVTRSGSVVRLSTSSTTVITNIGTEDSIGDTVLAVVHKAVPRVQGYLPEICYHGFKVSVVGDAELDGDNYFVKFVAEDPTNAPFSKGYWEECNAAGITYQLDDATMPHLLVRTWNGATPEFRFRKATWGDRTVGDLTSVPNPSFVGKKVVELFFYKNRLGFLADDVVNLSETGEYYNFFRVTLLTLRDSEPIDLTLSHKKVAILRNAVSYDEDMVIFSDRSQFVLRGGEILSPRTVQMIPVSEFESTVEAEPFSAGRSIFFAFKRGTESGLRELYQVGDVARFDASDTTSHIPNYISGKVKQIAGTTLEDTLVVRTDTDRNKVYFHKYMWSGQEKVQSAWGSWDFGVGTAVHHVAFVENTLWLLIERSGGLYLERMELASGLSDDNSTYVTHLDRRVDQVACLSLAYDAASNQSTFTLPFQAEPGVLYEVVEKSSGIWYSTLTVVSNSVTVRGDLTGKAWWCGKPYSFRFRPTPPIVKLTAGQGVIGENSPNQSVLRGFLQYSGSRTFKVNVRAGVRDKYTYEFNGWSPNISSFSQVVGLYMSATTLTLVGFEVDSDFFTAGEHFSLQGTAFNDGLYTVVSTTPTTITISESFTDEGSAGSPVVGVTISHNPLVGTATMLSGEFQFPVMGQADEVAIDVINNSPYPSNLTAATWLIRYSPRGQRFRG